MSQTYSAEYAAMITTKETNSRVIILDCINETTVTASSTLTSHPTVIGDNIADHMYREPITYSLSGMFASNGSQGLVIENGTLSLQDMQSLFEEIKNKGILCEIVRIKVAGDDKKATFQTRHDMALTSITWTEKINTLGFNFTFNEALQAEVSSDDIDTSDENLPSVTYPNNLSFTDALIDWSKIDEAITATLSDLGVLTEKFLQYMSTLSSAALIGLGIGLAVATSLIIVFSSVPMVGWIAGAVVAVGIFAYGLYKCIAHTIEQKKFKVTIFEYNFNNAIGNEQNVRRYAALVNDIHTEITQLNNSIIVKQISTNEEQEVIVTIGDYFYTFTFLRNNVTQMYSLKVTLVDEQEIIVKELTDITTVPTNWYDCRDDNYLFVVKDTGEYVYLLFVGEDTDVDKKDLTKYYIVISSINPKDFNNAVVEIIKNKVLY